MVGHDRINKIWSTSDNALLIEMKESGKPYSVIGDEFGVSPAAAKTRYRRLTVRQSDVVPHPSKNGHWTASEIYGLEKLRAEGKTAGEIAKIFDRKVSDVAAKLTWATNKRRADLERRSGYHSGAVQVRILELHAEEATSSRIGKRVDMSEVAVNAHLARHGRKPNSVALRTVSQHAAGRYGVDLPLPTMKAEQLPPPVIRTKPKPVPAPVEPPAPVVVELDPKIVETPDPVVIEPPLLVDIVDDEPEPAIVEVAADDVIEAALEEQLPTLEQLLTAEPEPKLAPEQEDTPMSANTGTAPDGGNPWSPLDVNMLKQRVADGLDNGTIAGILGRSETSVEKARTKYVNRASKPLPKTKPPIASIPSVSSTMAAAIAALESRIAVEQATLASMRQLHSDLSRAA